MARVELPVDRLATTDASGRRLWLYPTEVKGRFRTRRDWTQLVLIIILLALPWIRINGTQAVLFDIPGKKLSLFGLTFWAHDAPMLALVAVTAVLSLSFVTAVWGRVWCGWACPQTVFIDGVFRRIERWTEGDALARRRLDEADWSLGKFGRKSAKWALFTLVAAALAHTLLFYLAGTDHVLEMIQRAPSQNMGFFGLMAFLTGAMLFDFGWFREQFCTVVCPYGRFQSVLMDDQSLTVTYDARRGEARKGSPEALAGAKLGDCVNCFRCVQVCPTGIDIRRGTQLECISCTACMDACDDVMTRLGKPTGLIRYDEANASGKFNWLRSRTWVYLGLLAACVTLFTVLVAGRKSLSFELIRAVGVPYEEVAATANESARVINHFKVDFVNQSIEPVRIELGLTDEARAQGFELVLPPVGAELAGGASDRRDIWIRFPREALKSGRGKIELTVKSIGARETSEYRKDVSLVGPLR